MTTSSAQSSNGQRLSNKGASKTTPVSAVWSTNQISHHATNKIVENALRDAVVGIGEEKLSIKTLSRNTPLEIVSSNGDVPGGGTHFAIMMIGRWSSNAFMK